MKMVEDGQSWTALADDDDDGEEIRTRNLPITSAGKQRRSQ